MLHKSIPAIVFFQLLNLSLILNGVFCVSSFVTFPHNLFSLYAHLLYYLTFIIFLYLFASWSVIRTTISQTSCFKIVQEEVFENNQYLKFGCHWLSLTEYMRHVVYFVPELNQHYFSVLVKIIVFTNVYKYISFKWTLWVNNLLVNFFVIMFRNRNMES